MRSAHILAALTFASLALPAAACGNGDDTTSPNPAAIPDAAASDATRDGAKVSGDATVGADAEAGTTGDALLEPAEATSPPVASLRMANWSSDAPAVDFCIAPHGTTAFEGPLLASHASSGDPGGAMDAGLAALPFPSVSSYFFVAPGQYDARLVAAGATNCSAKIVADVTTLPTLVADGALTVALVGETHPVGGDAGDPGLRLVGFTDDTVTGSFVALRFINAAPNLAQADIWTGSGSSVQPLFLAIPFGAASAASEAQQAAVAADAAAPSVDPNGYATVTPALVAATFKARARFAMSYAAVAVNVNAAAGAILTVVVLRADADVTPDAGISAQLLECVDNAGTVGLFGNCNVISQ